MNRKLTLAAFAILMFGACAAPPSEGTAVDAASAPDTLTEEAAREAIEHSSSFDTVERMIHLLEWQANTADVAELLVVHKSQVPEGLLVEIEILPAGQPYIRSGEYFAGGVIPLTLVQPLVRRVVEIKSIRDTDTPGTKEVRFAWDWKDVPEVLGRMKPELVDGPRPGKAWVQLQADSWQVIGNVRDFHTSL